ncbi:MAG: S8 family serine peptidase [Ferruginibacter sp.]
MQKILPLFLLSIFISFAGHAQFSRYIIKFKDKGTNPFSLSNPSQYLSQRALDRRARYNIAIDSTDLPLTPRYIDSLRLAGNVTILNVSKWMNQVAIQTTDAVALNKINNFPFVLSTAPLAARSPVGTAVNKELDLTPGTAPTNNSTQSLTGYYNYGQSQSQVRIHNGDFLHNHGFRGEGMQMAIMDAGFYHYLSLPTFDSVRNNNQVLGTWDFVANEANVDEDYYHGMQCFSTIAANMPGTFVGTAPKTSFYLFRTEDVGSEYPIEEQNWAAGAERADSLGVDITSTSLGYTRFDNSIFDHTYADMDGNTTISARAADIAAKKGILVVAANGNEGNNTWHYVITPADADSTLSVGAVDIMGNVAGFSSYGPSGDGQVKPSVAAVGQAAVVANTGNGQPTFNSGTSFACPNMAGITSCLWQAFPEVNNMSIIEVLELSGTRSNNPDDRVGYGIPDAKKAFVILQKRNLRSAINCYRL